MTSLSFSFFLTGEEFLNTVAIFYSSTAELPFGTIVVITLIWTLVTSPLLVMGGLAGKNSKTEFHASSFCFQLDAEDHEWWWRYKSFLIKPSFVVFVFCVNILAQPLYMVFFLFSANCQ